VAKSVAGVVLAAGAGRRFGMPKALARVDGGSLLSRAVETLRAADCSPIIVVLGARADAVRQQVALDDVRVVVNDAWAEGMSTSFRAGLRACEECAAAVIAVVDQPGMTSAAVRRLIDVWMRSNRPVAVSAYGGAWRNPVLFAAEVFAEVADAVEGDTGAKPWLQSNPGRVLAVEVGDIADPTDIDTPPSPTSSPPPPASRRS
jgi:CTP:molybdopterin cytidylyltransferase MocA